MSLDILYEDIMPLAHLLDCSLYKLHFYVQREPKAFLSPISRKWNGTMPALFQGMHALFSSLKNKVGTSPVAHW